MLELNKPDWILKAHCVVNKIATKTFYESYEKGNIAFKQKVENICQNECEVSEECFAYGRLTKSTGLFGGIYLENGKQLRNKGQRRTYIEDKRDEKARQNRVA